METMLFGKHNSHVANTIVVVLLIHMLFSRIAEINAGEKLRLLHTYICEFDVVFVVIYIYQHNGNILF